MKKITRHFLADLKVGDRLFNFTEMNQYHAKNYRLYSVVKIPSEGHCELMEIFDEDEKIQKLDFEQMIKADHWWYNPEFETS